VMGDSAKKKTIRVSATNESIRFDSLICQNPLDSPHQGFWTDPEAAGPVYRSYDRPARVATELLIAFAEASGDIDANVSHDAILQHSDARS